MIKIAALRELTEAIYKDITYMQSPLIQSCSEIAFSVVISHVVSPLVEKS